MLSAACTRLLKCGLSLHLNGWSVCQAGESSGKDLKNNIWQHEVVRGDAWGIWPWTPKWKTTPTCGQVHCKMCDFRPFQRSVVPPWTIQTCWPKERTAIQRILRTHGQTLQQSSFLLPASTERNPPTCHEQGRITAVKIHWTNSFAKRAGQCFSFLLLTAMPY